MRVVGHNVPKRKEGRKEEGWLLCREGVPSTASELGAETPAKNDFPPLRAPHVLCECMRPISTPRGSLFEQLKTGGAQIFFSLKNKIASR